MAATERPNGTDGTEQLARRLTDMPFVEICVAPSLGAIAATGIVTAGCTAQHVPFQASIDLDPTDHSTDEQLAIGAYPAPDNGVHIPLESAVAEAQHIVDTWDMGSDQPLLDAMRVLGADPETNRSTDGLGVPTRDTPAGISHSTLVHGPFSNDPETATTYHEQVDGEPVAFASVIALETLQMSNQRAADAIGRVLGPISTPDSSFETAAGTADVLDVLSETDPGLALALVCGQPGVREQAITHWQQVAADIHEHAAAIQPDDDAVIVTIDADVAAPGVLARLVRDFRSEAPVTLVTSESSIGIASPEASSRELADALDPLCDSIIVRYDNRITAATPDDLGAVVSAIREVHT